MLRSLVGSEMCIRDTTNRVLPPELSALPTKYDEVPPRLGPPLPGDLGFAILGRESEPPPADNQFRFQGTPRPTVSSSPAYQQNQQTQQPTSADSPLFFIENTRSAGSSPQWASAGAPAGNLQQLAQLTLADQSPALQPIQTGNDPNGQDRKQAFLGAEVDAEIYNPHRLQTPVSPFQVMAGTIIPASLVTGLNSDLPGHCLLYTSPSPRDS